MTVIAPVQEDTHALLKAAKLHRWNKQTTLRDNTWAGPYLCAFFYSLAAQIFSELCSIVSTTHKLNAAQWATEGEQVPGLLELLMWKLLSTWKRILDEGGLDWWLLLALTCTWKGGWILYCFGGQNWGLCMGIIRRQMPALFWEGTFLTCYGLS